MANSTRVEIDGSEVHVRLKIRLEDGGARFVIKAADGRKWLVDADRFGDVDEVVMTWRDGELADVETPEWLERALDRVVMVA